MHPNPSLPAWWPGYAWSMTLIGLLVVATSITVHAADEGTPEWWLLLLLGAFLAVTPWVTALQAWATQPEVGLPPEDQARKRRAVRWLAAIAAVDAALAITVLAVLPGMEAGERHGYLGTIAGTLLAAAFAGSAAAAARAAGRIRSGRP